GRLLIQPDDVAVFVQVDAGGRGVPGQAGHGAHVAADRVDEAGADARADLADREAEARGGALEVGVVAQAVLGLGDADREAAEAVLLVAVELAARQRRVVHAVRAVDLGRQGLDLLLERRLRRVQVVEAVRLARYLGDRLGDLGRTAAAVGEVRADRGPHPHGRGELVDRVAFRLEVTRH